MSVADEPHNLEEFPPRAMTGYKTYFEGHGEFCASASSWYNQSVSTDPIYPWSAFNKGALGFSTGNGYGNNWEPATPATYSTSTGLYTGASGFFTAGIGGDWVQLELPYAITLDHMEFMPAYYNNGSHIPLGVARSPKDGHIMASNDGIIWVSKIDDPSAFGVVKTDSNNIITDFVEKPKDFISDLAIIGIYYSLSGIDATSIKELKFFGTREQGQSVLHDGQLTLTKNLNVPRIGPALDADDTPRRDRLVVEYNTSTNPTFEGAVRDTSGRGNDGVFYGGASYDATEKAFEFPSNSPGGTGVDYIRTKLNVNQTGDITHSASIWFKTNSGRATSWRSIFEITDAVPRVDTSTVLSLYIEGSTDKLVYITGTNYLYSSGVTLENFYSSWNHAVITYDGANKRMYYNGRLIKTVAFTGWVGVANPALSIGMNNHANADQALDGSVSNFKCYYGHALTAEEVKTLYDMGRTGSVAKRPSNSAANRNTYRYTRRYSLYHEYTPSSTANHVES